MSPQTKNKLILLAMIGPFVLFFLYGRFVIDPWELPRQNLGQLLIPHIDMDDLEARDEQGNPYGQDHMAGAWTLMYIAGADCDTACKNALYYQVRQVRLTLGEDLHRVRRLVVLTETPSASLRDFLDDQVAGMLEIQADLETVSRALQSVYEPEASQPQGDIFLVSPDGQIFMRYPSHEDMDATLIEAENIRVDIKRTLKGSLIG